MMASHPDFDLIIANIGGGPGMGPRPGGRGRRLPPGHPPIGNQNNRQGASNGPPDGPPPWMRDMMTPDGMLKQYKKINEDKPLLGLIPDMSPNGADDDEGIEGMRDQWKFTSQIIKSLIELKIPYYPTISRAANAVSKMIGYYQRNGH